MSGRIEGLTGVWIEPEDAKKQENLRFRSKSSRWVTMHGIGFNVNTDLSYFDAIIPCGIKDKKVTSLEKELNRKIDFNEVSKN